MITHRQKKMFIIFQCHSDTQIKTSMTLIILTWEGVSDVKSLYKMDFKMDL